MSAVLMKKYPDEEIGLATISYKEIDDVGVYSFESDDYGYNNYYVFRDKEMNQYKYSMYMNKKIKIGKYNRLKL